MGKIENEDQNKAEKVSSNENKRGLGCFTVFSCFTILLALLIMCANIVDLISGDTYYYPLSYTRDGRAAIKEAAKAHKFGEVFDPGFKLDEGYVLTLEKVVGIPPHFKTQFIVVYVDPGISLEDALSNNISYQYALIQKNEATKDLTISKFVELANSGSQDLLYGGY